MIILTENLRVRLQKSLTRLKLPIIKLDFAGTTYDTYAILNTNRDYVIRQLRKIGFKLRIPYYPWLVVMTYSNYKVKIIPYQRYQVIIFDPELVYTFDRLTANRTNL